MSTRAPAYSRASASNPNVDVPVAGETSRGGHAVWAPKYDATGLWIENSWGTGWGAAGWGHLTWAFVNGYAREGYTYTSTYDVPAGTTVVYSTSPTSGPVGTNVTITGSAFTDVTAVSFAGTPAAFSVVNDTTITTTVPAGAASGYITLTSPSNPSAGSPSAFMVTKMATALTYGGPTSAVNGSTVTLSATLKAGTTPLSGQTVTFTVGSTRLSGVTDASGVARVTWTAPKSKSPAKLAIAFAGTAIYAASSLSTTIKIR